MDNSIKKIDATKAIIKKMVSSLILLLLVAIIAVIYKSGLSKFLVLSLSNILSNILFVIVIFFVFNSFNIDNLNTKSSLTSKSKVKKIKIYIDIIYITLSIAILYFFGIDVLYEILFSIFIIAIPIILLMRKKFNNS